MQTTQPTNVTVPDEMAKSAKASARTDKYPLKSETIENGLRSPVAQDSAMENWLHDHVGPALDALRADPSRAIALDQVRGRLAAEHARMR